MATKISRRGPYACAASRFAIVSRNRFASAVRRLVVAVGSQAQLARDTGIPQQLVSMWMRARCGQVSLPTLRRLIPTLQRFDMVEVFGELLEAPSDGIRAQATKGVLRLASFAHASAPISSQANPYLTREELDRANRAAARGEPWILPRRVLVNSPRQAEALRRADSLGRLIEGNEWRPGSDVPYDELSGSERAEFWRRVSACVLGLGQRLRGPARRT